MKKALFCSTIFASVITLVSCGTISGSRSSVALVDAPSNLSVKADGESIDIERDLTVSKLAVGMNSDTYTDYYSPVVKLNKKKPVSLELSGGGKGQTIELVPKYSGTYLLGNLFTTGGLGIVIDIATSNHKKHPRFIDVPAALAGKPKSEWRSKGQLKRAIKKGAKK